MRKAPEMNPCIALVEAREARQRALRDRRGYLARLRVRIEAERSAERKGRMRQTYIGMCYGMSPQKARQQYLAAMVRSYSEPTL